MAKAELFDLFLDHIGSPVAIPEEVERECCGSKKALDAIVIQRAVDESRVSTVEVKNRRLVARLQASFTKGVKDAAPENPNQGASHPDIFKLSAPAPNPK